MVEARVAHDTWLKQLPPGTNVQELAKRLQRTMQDDEIFRRAVAAELLNMTKRWEAWTEARLSAPSLALDDGCEANARAASARAPDDVLLGMRGLGPPPPAEAGSKYRIWCVARLREVERELVRELASAAAASVRSL